MVFSGVLVALCCSLLVAGSSAYFQPSSLDENVEDTALFERQEIQEVRDEIPEVEREEIPEDAVEEIPESKSRRACSEESLCCAGTKVKCQNCASFSYTNENEWITRRRKVYNKICTIEVHGGFGCKQVSCRQEAERDILRQYPDYKIGFLKGFVRE